MTTETEGMNSALTGVELEHPLPEEIREMDRDDTVCKFCGVSYFIHHEIKQLQQEIADLKKELELRQNVQSENTQLKSNQQALNERLGSNEAELTATKRNLENTEKRLFDESEALVVVQEKLKSQESENCRLQEEIENLRKSGSNVAKLLPGILQQTRNLKSNLPQLRNELRDFKTDLAPELERLKQSLSASNESLIAEVDSLRKENTDYVKQLANITDQLNQSNYTCTKLTSENEELHGLDKAYSQIKSMYELSQKQLTESDHLMSEKNEELRRKALEVTQLQQINSSKNGEMETLKKQLENSSATMQKSIQWYKDELQTKSAAVNNLETQIAQMGEEIAKRESMTNQRVAEYEQTVTEYEKIKEAFLIAKGENENLRQEREVLIAAHQRRIEELQENFRERLNSGGTDFEMKMKEVLQNERDKFEREKQLFLDSMAANHKIELDIERQKFDELQGKQNKLIESTRNEMIAFAREEARSLQTTISNLKRDLEVSQTSYDEKLESKQRELDLLNQRLRSAEEKLKEQQSLDQKMSQQSSGRVDEVIARNGVLEKEKEELSVQLENALSEVKSLQDTVRRECEERFELTEALAEARETLLKNHLQINPNTAGHNLQFLNKYSMNNGSVTRLPDLNSTSAPATENQKSNRVLDDKRVTSDLPPKGPANVSSRSLQSSQYAKEPTPPQPESRDGSHRSFARRSSTLSRASVSSNNSNASQPAERTIALYRASKMHVNKTLSSNSSVNGSQNERKMSSNGAYNEFKTMLNLAMRRGSSQ